MGDQQMRTGVLAADELADLILVAVFVLRRGMTVALQGDRLGSEDLSCATAFAACCRCSRTQDPKPGTPFAGWYVGR